MNETFFLRIKLSKVLSSGDIFPRTLHLTFGQLSVSDDYLALLTYFYLKKIVCYVFYFKIAFDAKSRA